MSRHFNPKWMQKIQEDQTMAADMDVVVAVEMLPEDREEVNLMGTKETMKVMILTFPALFAKK